MSGRLCVSSLVALILVTVLTVLWLVQFTTSTLHAQVAGAAIMGTVTDETGGVLPGVTVTVKNTDTGIERTVTTDQGGRYQARNLTLGVHDVTAKLSGFQTAVRAGITLTVGREAVVNLTTKIGGLNEQLVVTGEAALVDTTSSAVGGLVDRTQVSQIPLRSRDYSQLIMLQPGVTNLRQMPGTTISGYGVRLSVSGARTSANAFLLDGINMTTEQGQLASGVTGAALGVEALQEFKVLTGNYSAQYGRAAGANVVAATRSGTNNFHGSAYWYLRNEGLDAPNFFDEKGAEKPDFRRDQFGFSLGGPIARNRAFFFGNYEGLRDRFAATVRGVVPDEASRKGSLPNGRVTIDPRITPFLNLYPLPNGKLFGDGTGEFVAVTNAPTDQNFVTMRLDHKFSDRYSAFGRFTRDASQRDTPDLFSLVTTGLETDVMSFSNQLTAVFTDRLFGSIRVGVSRISLKDFPAATASMPREITYIEGRTLGLIDVAGLTSIPGFLTDAQRHNRTVTPQGAMSLEYTRGRHSLKFGAEFEHIVFSKTEASSPAGEIRFGSLVDFLTNGPPQRFRAMGAGAMVSPDRTLTQRLFGSYIQDDMRITPRFTLNLGVRYSMTTVPRERDGKLSNIRYPLDPAPTLGDPYYRNDALNFAPRLGFAWDVSGDSRTALRGGFGIFHEPMLSRQIFNTIVLQPPFWIEVNPPASQVAGIFPFFTENHIAAFAAQSPLSVHAQDFDIETPQMVHYSLGLERQLGRELVATVTYIGTRGINLVSRADFNIPTPTVLSDGRTFFAPQAPLFNPRFASYKRYGTDAESWYNGLQVSVRKRTSSGFMFQGSYTFSKNVDTQSSHMSGETLQTRVMNPFDHLQDKALADTDIRHNFVGNWVYELPFAPDAGGVGGALLAGWSVSGVVSLATGSPISVSSNAQLTHRLMTNNISRPDLAAGGNNNPVLGGPDRYFDVSQFVPQQPGFFGNVGRNTLIAPGLATMDLSLSKKSKIRGERDIVLRIEFFNFFNRANFSYPNTALFNNRGQALGAAGRITETTTTARQIQLSLRFGF